MMFSIRAFGRRDIAILSNILPQIFTFHTILFFQKAGNFLKID